jgi:serine/threonine-protein kinase
MGAVYKARQVSLNRIVAVKVILAGYHAGAVELARFRQEGEAIANLQHPNIVQVHELGIHEGSAYLVMEYCRGGSMASLLQNGRLPAEEAARLVATLAQAMQAAHQKGIIHRDLKPANVLLGEDGTPKISDFGLARRVEDDRLTQTGALLGTPSYMAPEQAQGQQLGPAADIWALGAILYECLTGQRPFRGSSMLETLDQVRHADPPPVRALAPNVPRDLETICLKCLQKDPAHRYHSAAHLAEDLRHFLGGTPIQARSRRRGWRAWWPFGR